MNNPAHHKRCGPLRSALADLMMTIYTKDEDLTRQIQVKTLLRILNWTILRYTRYIDRYFAHIMRRIYEQLM